MKLVTFESSGESAGIPRLGLLLDAGGAILDLDNAARLGSAPHQAFSSMLSLIEGGEGSLDLARQLAEQPPAEATLPAANVRLIAPLQPPRMRDTLLYMEHMEQGLDRWARSEAASRPDPESAYRELKASGRFDLHPVFREMVIYYNANHLAISGPGDEIFWPAKSGNADFELELACIMGRRVHQASKKEAADAIFGYTIYNDWSARDLQLSFMKANLGPAGGKDFAGSNTLGPYIATADEIDDVRDLGLVARVNGEVWTDSSTNTMHHSFVDAIIQLSELEPLVPGEVIGSGTVLNGSGFEQGRQLRDGDVVELEIEGLGILRNTVRMGR